MVIIHNTILWRFWYRTVPVSNTILYLCSTWINEPLLYLIPILARTCVKQDSIQICIQAQRNIILPEHCSSRRNRRMERWRFLMALHHTMWAAYKSWQVIHGIKCINHILSTTSLTTNMYFLYSHMSGFLVLKFMRWWDGQEVVRAHGTVCIELKSTILTISALRRYWRMMHL
jgi:hypothetical protein